MSPTNSGAPAPTKDDRGGVAVDLSVDDPLMQWADADYRAARTSVLCERRARVAGLELSYRHGRLEHSERWERNVANELAARGFSAEYLARRYGLTMRGIR